MREAYDGGAIVKGDKTSKQAIAVPIAMEISDQIMRRMEPALDGFVVTVDIAGSLRRKMLKGGASVNDIDLLVQIVPDAKAFLYDRILELAKEYAEAKGQEIKVFAQGEAKVRASIGGVQIDFNIFWNPESAGSQLMHHTGSVNENIRLRALAIRKGMNLSQHGLKMKDGTFVAGRTEKEVYEAVGTAYVAPEDR